MHEYAELSLSEPEALQVRKLESAAAAGTGSVDADKGVRGLLGESRYPEYRRLQDPDYIRLQSFAQDEHLDLAKIREVFDQTAGSPGDGTRLSVLGTELSTHFGPDTGERWVNRFRRPGLTEPVP